jgi:adenosylcobinamide-phosphate synthase
VSYNYGLWTIFIAYLLDLIFGDPPWRWHPLRCIGRVISWLELKLNRDKRNKIFSGALCVVLTLGLTVSCAALSLEVSKRVHPVLCFVCYILLVYFALSVKDLAVEADKIREALENKDIAQARKSLSMIVGRDTETLSEQEIIRAAVETVAESTMDGIIAPLFYCFLGGPVWMWFYKTINTLDSMIGYTNARFIKFGRVAAKLDGLLNFVPARITSFLIGVSCLFYRKNCFGAFKWGSMYFLRGPAFNSQIAEAAMAGALKVRLGGTNYYNSVACNKPHIGNNIFPLTIARIRESVNIAYVCSGLFIITGLLKT